MTTNVWVEQVSKSFFVNIFMRKRYYSFTHRLCKFLPTARIYYRTHLNRVIFVRKSGNF